MDVESRAAMSSEERERYLQAGLWSRTETLGSLLADHARERPDSDAVLDARGTRLTYAELNDRAAALAGALRERGVERGAAVGVQLPNFAAASIVHCAIDLLGAVAVPLVPMYRDHELRHAIEATEMQALFVPGSYRRFDHDAMGGRLAEEFGELRVVSLSDSPPAGIERLEDLLAGSARLGEEPPVDPDAPAAILFTSGTEAAPKAAVHTNNTLLANNRSLLDILDLGPESAIFMGSPVGHGTGLGFGVRFAVFLGSKLVLQDIWEAEEAARTMAREGCVYTHASTTFAQDLLSLPAELLAELTSLEYFVTGGASVPPGFAKSLRDATGCTLLRLYGQTEGFMTTINRPGDPLERLDGFDGRAAPGVELEVRDDDGTALGAGEVGELTCRGPHRCLGFLNDPERTNSTFDSEGWMRMGDLGKLDGDGYLNVVGRRKEVISRGGYKFSPREVEELMLQHPAVAKAALVKMPDPRLGERACAFLILRDGETVSLEELVDFLKGYGLATFKLPERLELVEEFPTTPSGKVQKFELERILSPE
jgi:non-ribosomal peptide synthetase component E (peptide arylation enzyme)